MQELTLSVMRNTQQTEPVLRRLLADFERRCGIRVHLQMLAWETARQEIKNFAIHQRGPDVSMMATTWVADLHAMNALQPLKGQGGFPLGKVEDFIASGWETAHGDQEADIFAAPWLVDTYVIHYRRDLLQQAGIDAGSAFSSLEQIDATVARLAQSGAALPIQLPFQYDRFCAMHTLASWIWSRGGEFCTPEGNRVLFDSPQSLAGIQDYFRLARRLSPLARAQLTSPNSSLLFRQGQAALAFGTLSFMFGLDQVNAQVRDNWRVAPLPGPHFVGGVNLVIWRYSLHEQAALELIRFLNSPDVVAECAGAMLTSPARLSVLESPSYEHDPILRVFTQSARSGRSYFPVRLWGIIEERFMETVAAISNRALAQEDAPPETYIPELIRLAARRLNLTLDS